MTFRIPRSPFRVLVAFWRLNVAEELQYRANFAASLLGTLFWIGTALLTLALFFGDATRLGGWDYWEVVVLLGVFNALTGVVEAVLRPGIGRLAAEVRSGGLDLVLAKPVDAQGFVSFRRLDIWRLAGIPLGLGVAGYALARLGRVPSVAQLAAFAVALAAAAVVVYTIWVVLMSLAFWFVSVENLAVLFDAVYEGARYPVSAYPTALRFVFVYLIPIAWTTTIPASALTGRLGPGIALAAAAVAGLAFALARLAWRMALKRYTGASGRRAAFRTAKSVPARPHEPDEVRAEILGALLQHQSHVLFEEGSRRLGRPPPGSALAHPSQQPHRLIDPFHSPQRASAATRSLRHMGTMLLEHPGKAVAPAEERTMDGWGPCKGTARCPAPRHEELAGVGLREQHHDGVDRSTLAGPGHPAPAADRPAWIDEPAGDARRAAIRALLNQVPQNEQPLFTQLPFHRLEQVVGCGEPRVFWTDGPAPGRLGREASHLCHSARQATR